jgi:SAM-dependent methyltransferase
MKIPIIELQNLEKQFKNGSIQLQRNWNGFNPRENKECIDNQTIQRSIILSYCRLVGEKLNLSQKRAIEIGVEKHQHICTNLGLSKWERLDRLGDVGGNKVDYNFDFVEFPIPEEFKKAFDVIVCSNTLEHTFDIFRGFDNVFEMAKDGAFLYFSTPFSIGVHGSPDYWRLTPDCYRKILSKYTNNYIVLEESWENILHGVSAFAIKQ